MIPGCSVQNVHSFAPNYEAEPEPSIQDTITTIHNPFDNAQSQVIGHIRKAIRRPNVKARNHNKSIKTQSSKEAI